MLPDVFEESSESFELLIGPEDVESIVGPDVQIADYENRMSFRHHGGFSLEGYQAGLNTGADRREPDVSRGVQSGVGRYSFASDRGGWASSHDLLYRAFKAATPSSRILVRS